ncbi:MAG: hypothetical protein GY778_01260 [bacterium]|nr:hypothetical protein [bacterium]
MGAEKDGVHFAYRVRFAWGILLLVAIPATGANPKSGRTLGLIGGSDVLWVYQYRTESPGGQRLLRFAYQAAPSSGRKPVFLSPRRLQPVTGSVACAVVNGSDLHVIYEDGTHRRYDRASESVERNLPKPAVPLALACDREAGVLYALVPAAVAAELPPAARPGPTTRPGDGPTDRDGPGIAPAAGQTMPTSLPSGLPRPAFAIARYERGRWYYERDGPKELLQQRPAHLVVGGGVVHLLLAAEGSSGNIDYLRSTPADWSQPQRIAEVRFDEILAAAATDDGVALLVRPARSGGRISRLRLPADGEAAVWGAALDGTGQAVAAAVCRDQVGVAFLGQSDEVRVGWWPLNGGGPAVAPEPVEALAPRAEPWTRHTLGPIAFALLAVILVAVFVRRRESLTVAAPLGRGQMLARFSRRFLALALDGLISLPVTALAASPMAPVGPDGAWELPQDGGLFAWLTPEWLLVYIAAVGAYVVYAVVFETAMEATPGKRVLGCRVVTEQGERCRFRAILLRNLIRLVELFPAFELAPAIILVLLTRNRQRLGDLIAKTVVVETSSVDPAKAGPDPNRDG